MSEYTTISTIRHAETTYGEEQKYAGTIDVPLSETGIRDAVEASKKIRGKKFDVVITSAKKRAIQTADLLVSKNMPRARTALCNERNFGVLEGRTWPEAQIIEPKILFIEVGNDKHSVNPFKGEPFEALRIRAEKFQRFIFKRYEGNRVLVVSHGIFLQQFHGLLRGLSCIEALALSVSKLEFTTFRFKGLKLVGETSSKFSTLKLHDF